MAIIENMKYKEHQIVYLKAQLHKKWKPQEHWINRIYPDRGMYEISDRQMFSPSMLVTENEIVAK